MEANPQKENGHIDIANEIAEHFAKIRISGQEWQVLWVILRKTYGWHKKMDNISMGQITKLTGLLRTTVCRCLQSLVNKGVVTKNSNTYIKGYGLQKNYYAWKPLPKKVLPKTATDEVLPIIATPVTNNSNKTVANNSNKTVTNNVTHKRKKEKKETITKERFLEFVLLTKEENLKLIDAIGEEKTKEMIFTLNNYIGSKGKQYKSHYYTILSWWHKDKKGVTNAKGSGANRGSDTVYPTGKIINTDN